MMPPSPTPISHACFSAQQPRYGRMPQRLRLLRSAALTAVVLLRIAVHRSQSLQTFTGATSFPHRWCRPRPTAVWAQDTPISLDSKPVTHSQVLVIGAGVAGLAAAGALFRSGLSCNVIEASDGVGGVARTDLHDGYLLDRGFCVFNEAPGEVQAALDVPALKLEPLMPAVLIQRKGQRSIIADPRRVSLEVTMETLFNPICTIADKIRLATYVARLLLRPDVLLGPDQDAQKVNVEDHLLNRLQLSPSIVNGMFRPLLQGAYKIPLVEQPRKLCDNLFQNFWQCGDSFPQQGIGAVSQQLHEQLPTDCVKFGCGVAEISSTEVGGEALLDDGSRVSFDAAVIATDRPQAARFLGQPPDPRKGAMSTTLYFSLDEADLPFQEACKLLNGDGTAMDGRTVNSLAFPSTISPSRAPPGRALCGVVVVGEPALPEQELAQDVRRQLTAWFGPEVSRWTYLRSYVTRQALPSQKSHADRVGPRLFMCGDHTEVPAIYSALGSGLRVAAAVCQDLIGESMAKR